MRIERMKIGTAETLPGFNEWLEEMGQVYTGEQGQYQPMVAVYKTLQDNGLMKVAVALTDDGEMMGAVLMNITPSRHVNHTVISVDVLYLRKKFRKGLAGKKLLAEADKISREEGALGYCLNAIPGTSYDKVCEVLGYKLVRKMYWRSL